MLNRVWASSSTFEGVLQGPELLFYGDSIFELLRGTMHMEPDPRGHGIPEVFHKHFGQTYKTAVLGIAGQSPPCNNLPDLSWSLKERPSAAVPCMSLWGCHFTT